MFCCHRQVIHLFIFSFVSLIVHSLVNWSTRFFRFIDYSRIKFRVVSFTFTYFFNHALFSLIGNSFLRIFNFHVTNLTFYSFIFSFTHSFMNSPLIHGFADSMDFHSDSATSNPRLLREPRHRFMREQMRFGGSRHSGGGSEESRREIRFSLFRNQRRHRHQRRQSGQFFFIFFFGQRPTRGDEVL